MSAEIEMPPRRCPRCGHVHDKATAVSRENVAPKEGDWTVCLNCAGVLRFGRNLALQKVTPAEFVAAHPEEQRDLNLAVRAVLALHRHRQLQ